MSFTDICRVIMSKDNTVGIGDQQINNIMLLGRLSEEFLKLDSALTKSHSCPGAGLKRSYQGSALFQ